LAFNAYTFGHSLSGSLIHVTPSARPMAVATHVVAVLGAPANSTGAGEGSVCWGIGVRVPGL
jgi:hypothetical protein